MKNLYCFNSYSIISYLTLSNSKNQNYSGNKYELSIECYEKFENLALTETVLKKLY